MNKINERYKELLSKFAGNKEIKELLELVILDAVRIDEVYYQKNNSYPKKRDNLGKLKMDLFTAELASKNK